MKLHIAKTTAILAGAGLLLSSSAFAIDGGANLNGDRTDQQVVPSTAGTGLNAGDPALFINAANNINMAEIQMGRLARERGQSQTVRQLGEHMVQDHTMLEAKLKAVASAKDIVLPTQLDAKHQKKFDELASLSGAAFDRQYLDMQVKGHQKAISLFQQAAAENTEPAVRDLAKSALPQLQEHLQMAQRDAGVINEPAGARP